MEAKDRRKGQLHAFVVVLLVAGCSLPASLWSFVRCGRCSDRREWLLPRPVLLPKSTVVAEATPIQWRSQAHRVGDVVLAKYPGDGLYYPAMIDGIAGDRHIEYVVRWHDPEAGVETSEVDASDVERLFKDYDVGDDVVVQSALDGEWYAGVVEEVLEDVLFRVRWDDPVGDAQAEDVHPMYMKKVEVFKAYKKGDRIHADSNGVTIEAVVTEVRGDGKFIVSERGNEFIVKAKDMRYAPIQCRDLRRETRYLGIIKDVQRDPSAAISAAYVEFGLGKNGPFAEVFGYLPRKWMPRVHDGTSAGVLVEPGVRVGQEMSVWVVDSSGANVLLTAQIADFRSTSQEALKELAALGQDIWLDAKVQSIKPFGAFVSVSTPGMAVSGLVPKLHLSEDVVQRVQSEVEVGQELKVRVLSVDFHKKRAAFTTRQRRQLDMMDWIELEGSSETLLSGVVLRVYDTRCMVEIDHPTLDATACGTVHVKDIRDGWVESCRDEVTAGDNVRVWIKSVDEMTGQISLSMRAASKPPGRR